MSEPLPRPPKKNPQKRSVAPTRPPEMRSRAAMHLTAAAAEGRFALQRCTQCQSVMYPPRDACNQCLSTDLRWEDMPDGGVLVAETTVHTSPKLYFRERMPWRAGTIQLDVGPTVLAHIHSDVKRHARNPLVPGLVKALEEAGAAMIFVGEAESWLPYPGRKYIEGPAVDILPMDVTDTISVQKLAGEIGGKTDILINTAQFIRPGGVLERGDITFAAQEIDVNYLGMMRLAQAFGPGMCARAADGVNSAAAWVNLLSIGALTNAQPFGAFSASQAGAYSLSQSLRAEFRASGLRVMNVFHGPTEEDDWYQPLPPPRVTSSALSKSIIDGLQRGLEDVWCGDIAKDVRARFRQDPKVLEREMSFGGDGP